MDHRSGHNNSNRENKQKDEGIQPASFFQVKVKFQVKAAHFRKDISNKVLPPTFLDQTAAVSPISNMSHQASLLM